MRPTRTSLLDIVTISLLDRRKIQQLLKLIWKAPRPSCSFVRAMSRAKADRVVTFLPRAKDRYRDLVANIGTLPATHLTQARSRSGG